MSTQIEITVPDIGDVTDAEIIEIPVSVGDSIEKEDTLIILETDKATMDVPSPQAGVVTNIVCQIGDKVSQDSLILTIDTVAEDETAEPAVPEPIVEAEVVEVHTAEELPAANITTENVEAFTIQDVNLPDIGESDAVDVIELSVQVGDTVEKETPLIVLETDKATMEIPSPFAGKVISLRVSAGDKVSNGALIATIETANEIETSVEPAAVAELVPNPVPAPANDKPPVPDHPAIQGTSRKGLVYASPAIRRFARELGADLSGVKGTGTKGRILKEDVRQFVKYELSRPKATGNTCAFNLPKVPKNDFTKFGETESVPLSRIQKVSSVNLHRNWMTIPHVTQQDEADITEMDAFRKSMKVEAAAEGVRLTPLAFMMKAVVASLKAYPRFNSSLADDGENLILKKYFHIGVAVDTPDGLVVPVVKDVDKKSIYELANELGEVSAKARDKKLGIEGMQGSCFTISSLGGIGGTSFSPIVNWPNVAILGISKSSMKPVWDGKDFQPRLMLPLSLSYDHRVIDGAVAARFITHLSRTLGDIRRLVL